MNFSVAFVPLLPWIAIALLGALALAGVGYGLARRARGIWWRALALAALVLMLLNPSLKEEQREPLTDIALIVVDESPSQGIGDRRQETETALADLREKLARFPDLEVRVLRAAGPDSRQASDDVADAPDGTLLFGEIDRALADVPPQRLAGVLMITDGQVHDVPANGNARGPLHALLTGQRDARDRRLVVEQAPSYGIVGSNATITVHVEDMPAGAASAARLFVTRDGGPRETIQLSSGESRSFEVPVEHGGANVVELETEPVEGELTTENNRAAVVINGVRDRLRVLLVSGVPHNGERVWRNLLKADPAVDLVHFTILRPPEKQDGTPVRELSLIAFPTRELFEEKLNDFDLIIFDRYNRRGILPAAYIENIVRYVENGGAVLEAGGPSYASPFGLFNTPLGEIMPVVPSGKILKQSYRAHVTDLGRRHPVTAGLEGSGLTANAGANAANAATWGRWFVQTEGDARRGEVVMDGIDGDPLLVLDRVGKGRVAQIMTDQVWLWARGFDGGGPQAELLRRIAHWLMKEPELEEDDLRAVSRGSDIQITRHSLKPDDSPVTVRSPSGQERQVTLADQGDGRAIATYRAGEQGLHRVSDGKHTVYAVAGTLNPLEFADVRSTGDKLEPVIKAQGGSVNWLAPEKDSPVRLPDIRRVTTERTVAGRGWIGLRANHDYVVKGVTEIPLLPPLAALILAAGTLLLAWRREGR
ncbi:MAG TPA: hypothetical protein VGO34_00870 [Alphaproteobacteria bacterium]|jgi:hypothetical protein